jgi:toxin ParE1/3/4
MSEREWHVRLGAVAELDFANILKWTTENFGARQSRIYRDTLVRAIDDLANGPDVAGSKARDEIMTDLRTLHVARHGRPGRHFLLYRAVEGQIIEIESCTTRWICGVTCHFQPTRAADNRPRRSRK